MSDQTCSTSGCDNPIRYHAAQLCHACYQRARRRGMSPGAVDKSGPCPHECGRPWHPLDAPPFPLFDLADCPGGACPVQRGNPRMNTHRPEGSGMSAQEVIADQIKGLVLGSGWDVSATRDQANAIAARAVTELQRGHAVVELPKPDGVIESGHKDGTGDVFTWGDPDDYDDLVSATRGSGRVRIGVPDGRHSAEGAKALAAAILAAAAHADRKGQA